MISSRSFGGRGNTCGSIKANLRSIKARAFSCGEKKASSISGFPRISDGPLFNDLLRLRRTLRGIGLAAVRQEICNQHGLKSDVRDLEPYELYFFIFSLLPPGLLGTQIPVFEAANPHRDAMDPKDHKLYACKLQAVEKNRGFHCSLLSGAYGRHCS